MAIFKKIFFHKRFRLVICLIIGIYLMMSTPFWMELSATLNFADIMESVTRKKDSDVVNVIRTDNFLSTNVLPSFKRIYSLESRILQNKATYSRIPHPRQVDVKGNNVLLKQDIESDVSDMNEIFCTDKSKVSKILSERLGKVTSNMKNWTFDKTVECPYLNISEIKHLKPTRKGSLNCNISEDVFLNVTWTNDIYVASFYDDCVDIFITDCCKGNSRVPNIVHYVWYKRGELSFVGFTSFLSVIRFVKPCAIIFHGDSLPFGSYWDFIVNMSPNIIHLKREPPEYIAGQKIKHKEHASDIMRIEALLKYGGIYMDTDTLIVRSIEPLMNYSCVMSNQSSGLMASAFVMAEKNASFLQLWMDGYRFHYNPSNYNYNAMVYPLKAARDHVDLIHIEYAKVSRPVNMIGGKIYNNTYATYNWSHIYGIHLYSRIYRKPFNEYTIRTMNTTAGSICRHILFGNKELCNSLIDHNYIR